VAGKALGGLGAWTVGHSGTGEHKRTRCRQPLAVRASGVEASGGKRRTVEWALATLIDNRPVNAEGNLRALSLSVTDAVNYLEGRNFNGYAPKPQAHLFRSASCHCTARHLPSGVGVPAPLRLRPQHRSNRAGVAVRRLDSSAIPTEARHHTGGAPRRQRTLTPVHRSTPRGSVV
jgi:hypothetical protein